MVINMPPYPILPVKGNLAIRLTDGADMLKHHLKPFKFLAYKSYYGYPIGDVPYA
jgi:hypothetical protein